MIDLEDRIVELLPNQEFTIPKGVMHRTRVPVRTESSSPTKPRPPF